MDEIVSGVAVDVSLGIAGRVCPLTGMENILDVLCVKPIFLNDVNTL